MACTEKETHYNDIGTVFLVTVQDCVSGTATALDVSSTTVRQLILSSPDGTSSTKSAILNTDGTDGKIKYTTVDGDLSQVGTWRIQVRVVFGSSGDWKSDISTFKVLENL